MPDRVTYTQRRRPHPRTAASTIFPSIARLCRPRRLRAAGLRPTGERDAAAESVRAPAEFPQIHRLASDRSGTDCPFAASTRSRFGLRCARARSPMTARPSHVSDLGVPRCAPATESGLVTRRAQTRRTRPAQCGGQRKARSSVRNERSPTAVVARCEELTVPEEEVNSALRSSNHYEHALRLL